MIWRATRLFHPEDLEAPHGRGPEGWPLAGCAACDEPLPWPTRAGRFLPPKGYYALSPFCDLACRQLWDGPSIRRTAPVNFAKPRGRPGRSPFLARLPLRRNVTVCAHCRAPRPSLRWVSVGFACYRCGHLTHVKDGEWIREAFTAKAAPA